VNPEVTCSAKPSSACVVHVTLKDTNPRSATGASQSRGGGCPRYVNYCDWWMRSRGEGWRENIGRVVGRFQGERRCRCCSRPLRTPPSINIENPIPSASCGLSQGVPESREDSCGARHSTFVAGTSQSSQFSRRPALAAGTEGFMWGTYFAEYMRRI
jgi:hypothetical protein